MGWKKFFSVNSKSFTLFVIFASLAQIGILKLSGLFGKVIDSSPFDIFSFFKGFTCASIPKGIICDFWDPILLTIIFILNILWQLFLANLIIILYYKIKQRKEISE